MTKIKIDDFPLPSLNTLLNKWKFIRWRNGLKKDYEWLLYEELQDVRGDLLEMLGERPLKLHIEITFAKKIYDADNCVVYAKFFMDAFKHFVGMDDTHLLIKEVTLTINPEIKKDTVIYTLCPKSDG